MKRIDVHGLFLGAVAALSAAIASGCERVSYFSITGGSPEDETTPSTPTTTATATGTETVTATQPTNVTRAQVLEAVSTCASALYSDAASAAEALATATAAAAAAPGDAAKKQAARDAWNATIDLWQQTEVIQVGPAGPSAVPGGKNMRDLVYSWPLVSRCVVEQAIVSKAYEKSNFSEVALLNTRGLAAAEYLLFYDGADNACTPQASINANGSWAAIGAEELAQRKLDYAKVVTADVASQLQTIADAWSADGGDYAGQIANAGQDGSPFKSDQAAMNAVTDGLFYVDKGVKDLKVGRPLGLIECATETCPELVESRFAKRSRDHIRNNLLGFRRIFEGCEEGKGIGLDDLLFSLGAGALGAEMTADTAGAIAAADALPSADLAFAIFDDKAKVQALHAAVKQITDDLKTEFATALDVELPQSVEGDND